MPDLPDNCVPVINADEKFFDASRYKIPPFNWIPPEKLPLQLTQNRRKPLPETNLPSCSVLEKMEPEGNPREEHLKDKHDELTKKPHPESDFEHSEPPPKDEAALLDRPLKDVEAYRRLKLAFDLIVCKTRTLLGNINRAIMTGQSYESARSDYVAFLNNLDDHEPRGAALNPRKGFGYGKNLKWTFIDPIIESRSIAGKEFNLITGVTIVAEWNPHSSSSGIPLPDR
jgi:hypothetical protein